MSETTKTRSAPGTGGEAVYFSGGIGSLIFWWNAAEGLGEHLVAILKSFVWPAFLVYQALGALAQ
jgi:hypothetical protein